MLVHLDKDSKIEYLPGAGLVTDILRIDGMSIHLPLRVSKKLISEIVSAWPHKVEAEIARYRSGCEEAS